MTMRVLIADDEPPARARLRAMLATHPDAQLVAEASDGAEAVELIVREQPDLVLLDIRMPELDGCEVAEAVIALDVPPVVVFTTAHDMSASLAFEAGAVDYLLKPFDQARFDRAMFAASARVAARHLASSADGRVVDLLRKLGSATEFPSRFLVRLGRRMYFVRTDDIQWLDAEGNYVRLFADGRTHLLRSTMTAMEAQLNPARFVRVHRSAIVRIDSIREIEPHERGEYRVTMLDGTRFITSAAHNAKLRALMR